MKHCVNKHVIEFQSHVYHSLRRGAGQGLSKGTETDVAEMGWGWGQMLRGWLGMGVIDFGLSSLNL